jgi:hypothetical protein
MAKKKTSEQENLDKPTSAPSDVAAHGMEAAEQTAAEDEPTPETKISERQIRSAKM